MKLRWAPGSPFVRKVTVIALETGLDDRIERMLTDYHKPDSDIIEGPLNIGHIAIATGIGWIEFRMGDILGDWKARWPMLGAWYDQVSKRPSFQATVPA